MMYQYQMCQSGMMGMMLQPHAGMVPGPSHMMMGPPHMAGSMVPGMVMGPMAQPAMAMQAAGNEASTSTDPAQHAGPGPIAAAAGAAAMSGLQANGSIPSAINAPTPQQPDVAAAGASNAPDAGPPPDPQQQLQQPPQQFQQQQQQLAMAPNISMASTHVALKQVAASTGGPMPMHYWPGMLPSSLDSHQDSLLRPPAA